MGDMASSVVDSPIGPLGLVATPDGLAGVQFHAHGYPSEGTSPILDEASKQLTAYFAGELTAFDLPLDLEGSEFQRRCWLALATIPYGQTVSYGEQARRLGYGPEKARAVGAANGQNPLPLVLPCHRVIGADGSLVGYGGGLERKRALLAHEAEVAAGFRATLW
jgi:methylated-DNA-[protein]-cysteine S-methyltransferase